MFLHGMAGEQKREEVEEDEEDLQQYTPHIPGTVLYLHRTKDGGIGRALVDGTFEALQSIRLSASMITDHLANSYYEGLGRENLTHKTFVEEGKMPAPETGKGASHEEGEQKKGDEGEKAEEDEGEKGDGAENGGGEKGDAKSKSDQHGDGEKDGGG